MAQGFRQYASSLFYLFLFMVLLYTYNRIERCNIDKVTLGLDLDDIEIFQRVS